MRAGPGFLVSVVYDGQNLWADSIDPDSVVEVNPRDHQVVRTPSGGSYGFDSPAAMAAGGGDVWVLNSGDSSVTEIRASDGAFVRKLFGSRYGFSAKTQLTLAGGQLWVSNPAGNSVTECRPVVLHEPAPAR